jgi:ABC-type amino acid transport system permease subunit
VDGRQLADEILSGGFEVNIGACVSRAWELMKNNFGLMLGTTLLVTLCMQAAGFIPILGACIGLILNGPLLGGLYLFYLKLIRGEPATVGDGFSGFKRFGSLLGVFVLMCILIYLPFLPAGAYGVITDQFDRPSPDAMFVLLAIAGFLGTVYLAVSFFYALPLVADLELGAWDALQVSRKVINQKFFSFLGLGVVGCLIMVLGLMALCLGVFVAMPLAYAMWMYAYEDIFGAGPEVPLT